MITTFIILHLLRLLQFYQLSLLLKQKVPNHIQVSLLRRLYGRLLHHFRLFNLIWLYMCFLYCVLFLFDYKRRPLLFFNCRHVAASNIAVKVVIDTVVDSERLTLILDGIDVTLPLLLLVCVEFYGWLCLQNMLWRLSAIRLRTWWRCAILFILGLKLSCGQKLRTATDMAHGIVLAQETFLVFIDVMVVS